MESYIRPGCVVLSVYVLMSSAAWEQVSELLIGSWWFIELVPFFLTTCRVFFQLEGNLLQQVNCLVQDSYSDFWREARFLVHIGRRLASHKDGEYR